MVVSHGIQLSLTVTSQMYVPGTLNDVEHVLIDVGTGYYVEKVNKCVILFPRVWILCTVSCSIIIIFFLHLQNVEDSKAFFKRKIDFLTKQIEKIQPALQEKHGMKQGRFLCIQYSVVIIVPKLLSLNVLNYSTFMSNQILHIHIFYRHK